MTSSTRRSRARRGERSLVSRAMNRMMSTTAATPAEYVALFPAAGGRNASRPSGSPYVRARSSTSDQVGSPRLFLEWPGTHDPRRGGARAVRLLARKRLRTIEPRLKPGGKYEMATLEIRENAPVSLAVVRRLTKEAAALNEEIRRSDQGDQGPVRRIRRCKLHSRTARAAACRSSATRRMAVRIRQGPGARCIAATAIVMDDLCCPIFTGRADAATRPGEADRVSHPRFPGWIFYARNSKKRALAHAGAVKNPQESVIIGVGVSDYEANRAAKRLKAREIAVTVAGIATLIPGPLEIRCSVMTRLPCTGTRPLRRGIQGHGRERGTRTSIFPPGSPPD